MSEELQEAVFKDLGRDHFITEFFEINPVIYAI